MAFKIMYSWLFITGIKVFLYWFYKLKSYQIQFLPFYTVGLNEHEFEQTLGYSEAQGSLSGTVYGVFRSQRVRHNLVTE